MGARRNRRAFVMGAMQSPDALGVALLAMPDDEFTSAWPRLGDAVRLQLPQAARQACIDRYRRLTPHVEHTIARLTRLAPSGAGVSSPQFNVLTAADVLNAPPLRWLVCGVLPATGLACVYGASGSGKSFLALDLCTAIAAGAGCPANVAETRATGQPVTSTRAGVRPSHLARIYD